MIGVSLDTAEENARFAKKFNFPFSLVGDRRLCIDYGACDSDKDEYARRIAYVIDENGHIDQAYAKVDPKTYPHEQLSKL